MTWREVRPVTLGLVHRGDEFLVGDVPSGDDDPDLYRPPGGAVEFDESSDQALEREFREELGVDVEVRGLVGVIENRFSYRGERHHEVAFVHEAAFVADDQSERETMTGRDDGGYTYRTRWVTHEWFDGQTAMLVPEGLAELIAPGAPESPGIHRVGDPP